MPNLSTRSSGSPTPEHSKSLTDRVMARVSDAGKSVDRRAGAGRPKARRKPTIADPLAADATRTPEQVREARSLRRVFGDLGLSYRQYRRETGAPVSPDIRDAAYRFRRELNVTSLVSVAACLDALDILTW